MKRKLVLALIIIVGTLFLLPGNGYAWGVSIIETPEQGQKFYSEQVEIIIRFKDGFRPSTFKAWLNRNNITDKFEPIDNGMRALVGPDDGLRVSTEILETTRDDKGVWFIEGSGKCGPRHWKGMNFLKTKVKGKKYRRYFDYKIFFVDMRTYDAFEAMGYAVATDRLWQGELFRRQARGRLAQIFGPDQLSTDIFMRTIGYADEELRDGFETLDPEIRAIISGYAAGFNRRIAEIREDNSLLPFEFAALGILPEDWVVEDILAWIALLLRSFDPEALAQTQIDNAALYQALLYHFPDGQDMFEDLRWLNDPDALTFIPAEEMNASNWVEERQRFLSGRQRDFPANFEKAAGNMDRIRKKVVKKLQEIDVFPKMGSYAWTVAGSKTASGNPIFTQDRKWASPPRPFPSRAL